MRKQILTIMLTKHWTRFAKVESYLTKSRVKKQTWWKNADICLSLLVICPAWAGLHLATRGYRTFRIILPSSFFQLKNFKRKSFKSWKIWFLTTSRKDFAVKSKLLVTWHHYILYLCPMYFQYFKRVLI